MPAPLDLRATLRSKPTSLLGWSGLRDAMVVGFMARAGFDAILLDQQHGFHDTGSCVAGITEAALAGVPAIVRVKLGDFAEAARALDLGAAGVVAPMINTAAEAKAFAACVKYPPIGERSWGPGRAMQLRGIESGPDYLASGNAGSLAIAMCETREALAALDEILAVEGIDGIMLGPGDLSIAMSGGRLDTTPAEYLEAVKDVARRTRAASKIASTFAGSPEQARTMASFGYQLVSVAYDEKLIADAMTEAVKQARA
jgi:4-hydroxy-2-oxoheptanedioate aldolase